MSLFAFERVILVISQKIPLLTQVLEYLYTTDTKLRQRMEVLQNMKAKPSVWGVLSLSQTRIWQCIIVALQTQEPGPIAF